MRSHIAQRPEVLSVLICLVTACGTAMADIDLIYQPATQTATVDDVVSFDLVARSTDPNGEITKALDAIITWDSDVLLLLGFNTDSSPHTWTLTQWHPNCANEDVNPEDDIPDNDGVATYSAWASLSNPPLVGTDGFVVATFEFQVLAVTGGSSVAFLPQVAPVEQCMTRVFGPGTANDVTGDISTVGVVSAICGIDDHCSDGVFCNGAEVCDVDGQCLPATGDPCPDDCQQCDEDADECRWCVFDLDHHDGAIGTGDFGIFGGCFGQLYPPDHVSYDNCLVTNYDGEFGEAACGAGADPNCYSVGTGDFGSFAGCFALTCGECTGCFPD